MRRVYTLAGAAMVAIVVGSAPTLALACGGCTEEWAAWAPLHAGHPTCEAQEISIGHPIEFTTAPPLYRHHPGTWNCSAHHDTDCHRLTDCSYEYPAEDTFECDWKMQMYDWEISDWVDKGPPGGNCDCLGANWETANFEPRFECNDGGEYRAKIVVHDTPEDGPHGDDYDMDGYSDSVVLWAQGVVDWHPAPNAWCTIGPKGSLYIAHFWGSECGHLGHLDRVTVREKVTYEAEWTSDGRHHMDHDGANCYSNTPPDPSYDPGEPGNGPDGLWEDLHVFPVVTDPKQASYCEAHQVHQWATGWPEPPAADNDAACWQSLCSHTIKRSLEDDNGRWLRRTVVTKPGGGSWECSAYEDE
jgi:hypothetical protein